MPTFTYEVRQPTGKMERGTVAGESAEAVTRALKSRGYYVLSVRPVSPPQVEMPWAQLARQAAEPVFYPVSSKALANFFASMRVLLSAGMNVSEAMLTLSQQTQNRTLQRAALEIAAEASLGRPMSNVLPRYPAAFNQATLAAIEAGEESGLIEQVAGRLAKYFDRAFELEQTYRWHTFYPKMLLAALLLIPTAPTLVLEGFMPWLAQVWARTVPLAALIVIVWYGWRLMMRIPHFRQGVDGLKLTLPWLGSLARRLAIARWARALAMLSTAGVPLYRALVAAAAASGNSAIERNLAEEAQGVLEGRMVSEVIAASRQVPRMALDLIATAERSGSIEEALEKVAEYYESETDVGGKQTAVAVGILFYLLIAAIIAGIAIRFWSGYAGGYGQVLR